MSINELNRTSGFMPINNQAGLPSKEADKSASINISDSFISSGDQKTSMPNMANILKAAQTSHKDSKAAGAAYEEVWSQNLRDGGRLTSKAFVNGTIFTSASGWSNLSAIDASTGKVMWTREKSEIVEYPNGNNTDITVVKGGDNENKNSIYGLDSKTGKELWSKEAPSDNIAVSPDGNVYAQSGNKITAYDGKTGKEIWKFPNGLNFSKSFIKTNMVIGPKNEIYAGVTNISLLGENSSRIVRINPLSGQSKNIAERTNELPLTNDHNIFLSPDGTKLLVNTEGARGETYCGDTHAFIDTSSGKVLARGNGIPGEPIWGKSGEVCYTILDGDHYLNVLDSNLNRKSSYELGIGVNLMGITDNNVLMFDSLNNRIMAVNSDKVNEKASELKNTTDWTLDVKNYYNKFQQLDNNTFVMMDDRTGSPENMTDADGYASLIKLKGNES